MTRQTRQGVAAVVAILLGGSPLRAAVVTGPDGKPVRITPGGTGTPGATPPPAPGAPRVPGTFPGLPGALGKKRGTPGPTPGTPAATPGATAGGTTGGSNSVTGANQ